jgi:hypothetical protein
MEETLVGFALFAKSRRTDAAGMLNVDNLRSDAFHGDRAVESTHVAG